MKTAKNFVKKAAAKRAPVTIKSLSESFRIEMIPINKQSRLKNRHCVSMKKLLERTSSHGVKAKRAAANNPIDLLYTSLPILYTKTMDPSPNKVTKITPMSVDEPKILKKSASM